MAHTVAEEAKGRAAGWYQAGNLGGTGVGGGAGVWLASHFSKEIASTSLSVAILASVAALFFVADVRLVTTETIGQRLRLLGRDLFSMMKAAIPLFTIVLVCSPIGSAAMNNLWSAVAPDWHANAEHGRARYWRFESELSVRSVVWSAGGSPTVLDDGGPTSLRARHWQS